MEPKSGYLRRLKGMSGAEVAYRVGRRLRLVSAQLVPGGVPARDQLATDFRFLPPFVALSPEAQVAAAERIVAGRHVFSGVECDLGDPPSWNRDSLTHREDVDGDLASLWEANRHLHLPTLAQAHVITGDPRYLETIRRHVDSWISQCPVGRGANWFSASEIGIRLLNWSIAWQLVGGIRSRLFQTQDGVDFRERWWNSAFEQVRMVVANLSRYSSANHQLIGEAAGAYVAASTWPLWSEMRGWGERCHRILEEECQAQVAADGGHREQSSACQLHVLDLLLVAGLAARARGEDFSPLYWRRLETMVDFIASLTDFAGRLPPWGDTGGSDVVRLAPEAGFSPHGSLVATGAVLFERPDLAARAGSLDGKTMTLLGVQSARRLTYLKSRARQGFRPRQQFPESGYYLLGDAFGTPDEVRLRVDAGPLGYLGLAAHGHADALAFTLGIGDREILVDPTPKTAEPASRSQFRGTLAHNTVEIDGVDQSQPAGERAWSDHAEARCLELDTTPGLQRFVGEHSGYARLADPLAHRREIVFEPGRALIEVNDTLRCAGTHVARRAWHFADGCDVQRMGDTLRVVAGQTTVLLEPLEAVERVEIRRDDSSGTAVTWLSRVAGVTALRTRITYSRSRPFGI